MNHFQEDLWNIQKNIFQCPSLTDSSQNGCKHAIKISDLKNELVPDSLFVHNNYGEKNFPRAVFIGENPNSQSDVFGTLASVKDFIRKKGGQPNNIASWRLNGKDFFDQYFHPNADYQGFDQDTLYICKTPNWGIQSLLKALFPKLNNIESSFAFLNVVMCKGPSRAGNPSQIQWINCVEKHKWLAQCVKKLEPEIIFICSTNSWSWFSKIQDNEDVSLKKDYAYYSIFQLDHHQIKPLTIRIPHLSQPHFQNWVPPSIYREIIPALSVAEIEEKLIDAYKAIISQTIPRLTKFM